MQQKVGKLLIVMKLQIQKNLYQQQVELLQLFARILKYTRLQVLEHFVYLVRVILKDQIQFLI